MSTGTLKVTEAHEARGLLAGVDVQRAGMIERLVGDDAHRMPVDAAEAAQHAAAEARLYLQELLLVDEAPDDLMHVVGLIERVGTTWSSSRSVSVIASGAVGAYAGGRSSMLLGR